MEKEFCNYQQSLKLKKLGFDEPCMLFFSKELNMSIWLGLDERSVIINKEKEDEDFLIPTFSQAFRWFRDKYNLKSWIEEYTKNKYIYEIRPHKITDYKEGEIYVYATYEETELACLKKLIEIVESKSK